MSYESKKMNNTDYPFLFSNDESKSNLVKCSYDVINMILIEPLNQSNTFNLSLSLYPLPIQTINKKDTLKYMNMVNEVIDKNQGHITIDNNCNDKSKIIYNDYESLSKQSRSSSNQLSTISNNKLSSQHVQNIINISYQSNDSSLLAEGSVQESTFEFDSATCKSTNVEKSNPTNIDNSIAPSTRSTKVIRIGKKTDKICHSKEKTSISTMTQYKVPPPRPESQKDISIPVSLQQLKLAPKDKLSPTKAVHQSKQSLSPIQAEIFQKKIVPKKFIAITKPQNAVKSKSPQPNHNSFQIDLQKSSLAVSPSHGITHRPINTSNIVIASHQSSSKHLSSYTNIMKKKMKRESRNLSIDIAKEKQSIKKGTISNANLMKQFGSTQDLNSQIKKEDRSPFQVDNNTKDRRKSKSKSKPKMSFDLDLSDDGNNNEIKVIPKKVKEQQVITQDQQKQNSIEDMNSIENIQLDNCHADKLKKLKELKIKQEQKKQNIYQAPKAIQPNINCIQIKDSIASNKKIYEDKQINEIKVIDETKVNNNNDNSSSVINTNLYHKAKPKSSNSDQINIPSHKVTPVNKTHNESINGKSKPESAKYSFKLNFKVNTTSINDSQFADIDFLQ